MARNIRGITIEIDGSTTKLSAALKNVNSTVKTTQSSLKDVQRLLKLDPSSTVLLQQKQKLLKEAIGHTTEKLNTLKEAQKQAKQQLENGELGADKYDALQREIVETEQELKNLKKEAGDCASVLGTKLQVAGEKIKAVGDNIAEVGTSLTTKVTAPLAAAGAVVTTKFAEVDKTMQLTNKTMGNTAEEADLLSDAMEKAASNSTFGMSEAADATLNFARAGLDATEAANALAPAMNLAAGEGGNLDTVSAGLVATINGFGDSFDRTAEYADVFAAACNNSALDVDSLSSAMSTAAPTFSAAGYSVNDAALYMGVMANAGIGAEEAATSLKTGMARLVDPTKSAKKWLEKLGIEVTNADGSMKDSVTIQKDLHDAFANLSESEQLSAASAIFGKNQMDKWLALINTAPSEVEDLSDSISNCAGTTNEMADAMMSGFGGSIEKLKSSLDVLMTSLGELLSGYLTPIIEKIQAGIDAFMGLDDAQKDLIVRIAMVAAAIGPVLVIVGKVISLVGTIVSGVGSLMTAGSAIATFLTGTLVPAISGLVAAAGAVVAPFLPIIAIFAAVVAAGVLLYKNWDTVKKKAGELASAAKEKFEKLKTDVTKKITAAKEAVVSKVSEMETKAVNFFKDTAAGAKEKFETLKANVSDKMAAAKETAVSKASEIKSKLSDSFSNAASIAKEKFESLKANVSEKITAAKEAVASKASEIKENIGSKFADAASTAKIKFDSLKSNVTMSISNAASNVKSKADQITSNITSAFSSAASNAKSKFEALRSGIVDKVASARDKISGIVNKIKSFFSSMKLSFPKIKMPALPHFKLTGSFSLNPPSVPKLSIEWYAKAMENGMILNRPTIFGYSGGHYLGAGEAGSETVVGTHSLMDMIRKTNSSGEAARAINDVGAQMLEMMQAYYPRMASAKVVIGSDGVTAVNKGLQVAAEAEGRYR